MDLPAEARHAGTRSDLARILRALRQREASRRSGPPLSLRQLADKLGCSHMAVGFYLNGRRLPSPARFETLIALLGADMPEKAALSQALQRLAAPALVAGAAVPNRRPPQALPAPVAGFTGRVVELATLAGHAGALGGTTRIVLITGMPGVGKTALAVQWGHHAATGFPAGQLYVDMHAYDSHAPLSETDALGVLLTELGAELDGLPDLTARSARYHALLSEQSFLVLLDNVGSMEQVRGVLPPPPCVAVVTSRDRLQDIDELGPALRLPLGALPPAEAIALLRLLIGDRVDREPEAALDLAQRCGRVPLALRVAAEHVAARPNESLAHLRSELDASADILAAFAMPGDERADLRSVFSWSVRGLPAPAAGMFRLLGLTPGIDIDRHGLAALAGEGLAEADQLARTLVAAHLLEARGPARFGIHDLLHAYAASLAEAELSPSERRAAGSGLLHHYLTAASSAVNLMFPAHQHIQSRSWEGQAAPSPAAVEFEDAAAGAQWLAAERVNLVRACAFAAANGWPDEAIALALRFGRYVEDLHYEDMLSVYAAAAAAVASLDDRCDPADRAGVWTGLGLANWRLGRVENAARHIESAIDENQRAGNHAATARNLTMLAVILDGQGRYWEALACHRRALDLARASGDRIPEAMALSNLASAHIRVEEFQTAADLCEQAAKIAQAAGNAWVASGVNEVLAYALLELGDYDEALALAQECVTTFQSFGQVLYRLRTQARVGAVLRRMGRPAEAADLLDQVLGESRTYGSPRPTALVLNELGDTWTVLGDPLQALEFHTEALELADRHSNRFERARALVGLGNAHASAGAADFARECWHKAYEEYAAARHPAAPRVRARIGQLPPG